MCHLLPGGQGRWHRKRPSNPCTSCGAAHLLGGTGKKASAPPWAGTIHVSVLPSCLWNCADPRFEAVSCTVPGTRYNEGHWSSGQGPPVRTGLTGFSGRVEDSSVELAPMSNSKRMEEPIILPRKGDTRIALPGQVLYIRSRSTICVFYTCRRLSWPGASLSLGARTDSWRWPILHLRQPCACQQARAVGTDADWPVAGRRWRGPGVLQGCREWVCRLGRHRRRVTILNCATGQAKVGELVGVLGPSGVSL